MDGFDNTLFKTSSENYIKRQDIFLFTILFSAPTFGILYKRLIWASQPSSNSKFSYLFITKSSIYIRDGGYLDSTQ